MKYTTWDEGDEQASTISGKEGGLAMGANKDGDLYIQTSDAGYIVLTKEDAGEFAEILKRFSETGELPPEG